MSIKSEIRLYIPSLFGSLEIWDKDFNFQIKNRYLNQLVTSLDVNHEQKVHGLIACFFSTFGQIDAELPAGLYRYRAHHSVTSKAVLCADPVHLEVGMNDVTLTNKITDLTDDEAKELVELLNSHFNQDGLEFVFGSNQHWYVLFPDSELVNTTPLEAVLYKNIVGLMPASTDRNWQQIQNEAQMLLHSSQINQEREMAGLESINSLWFWGGGKPQTLDSGINTVFSVEDEIDSKIQGQMFAQALGCDWLALPKTGEQLLNVCTESNIVILDHLFIPSVKDDIDNFQKQLTYLDENIINPLLTAWKNNQIDLVIDSAEGFTLTPKRTPIWKFWAKPNKLLDIAKNISQSRATT